MLVVGLTGGIGSGKSTVARMFEEQGIPVYYADDEAKNLMITSDAIRQKLISAFGKETYKNGELNKEFLAGLIFNDKQKLQTMNSIVHPEVDKHFRAWVSGQKSDFVLQENAIIFENHKENNFDRIISVTAPQDIRIKRVMQRDGATKDQVLSRMSNQLDDSYKAERSDFVIRNTDLDLSRSEVKKICELLSK